MKYPLLVAANLRKAKGQNASILALVLVAAMLLNLWLILSTGYSNNFDARAETLASEDVNYVFSSRDKDFTENAVDVIAADSRTEFFTYEDCLYRSINCRYGNGDMNTTFLFLPVGQAMERQIGKYQFTEKISNPTDRTVYLPYLFQTGGGYKIGDDFTCGLGNKSYVYTVGGFYENMLTGSFNGGLCTLLMEQSAYGELEAAEEKMKAVSFCVQIKPGVEDSVYASQVGEKILKGQSVDYNYTWYSMNKQARTLTASICSAIISAVAFLMTAIALIVIAFHVSNGIEEDMRNLGVLKAVGYESKQLSNALLFQYLFLSALGLAVGIGLSYALVPLLGSLLAAQTGIVWAHGFYMLPLLASMLIVGATVALTVAICSRKLRKLTPLTALRQGVQTHSFKRNPLPLEKTKLPANLALAMKTTCRNLRQNTAIFVVVLALSFLSVFSAVMFQNFSVDPGPFLSLVGGEQSDLAFVTTLESKERILADLEKDERVEKVYEYSNSSIYYGEGNIMCYIAADTSKLNNPEICYDGRLPLHQNEIAVGGLFAKENSYRIGDTIRLHVGEKEAEYLICGFIQSSNHLGRDCMMTSEGYSRIDELKRGHLYVNLKEGVSPNEFIDFVSKTYGTDLLDKVNVSQVIEGSLGVYTRLVSMIVAAIMILSLIIIAFVLYLMVKSLLIRKKRDYGIYKSLGYTTGQLVFQTAASFMPSILLSAIVGTLIGVFAVNPLVTLFFSGIGVMKCTFFIPPLLVSLFSLFIVVAAFGISCLVSLRTRRITPRALVTGE